MARKEAGNARLERYDEDIIPDLGGATDWDIATRYADFGVPLARGTASETPALALRRVAASAILRRAKQLIGSIVRPTTRHVLPWPELPADAQRVELDLEETIENTPEGFTSRDLKRRDQGRLPEPQLWMGFDVHRSHPLVLCLDASLSMMGENQALMGVAVAAIMLELPTDPLGVIAFDDDVTVLKRPDERIAPMDLIERLLDVPGRPYTNMEAGLRKALQLGSKSGRVRGHRINAVLVTDGKYTSGRDPAYLAAKFSHLVVLKVGAAESGRPLCVELANRGRGSMREVPRLESLPDAAYHVVRALIRGRSV